MKTTNYAKSIFTLLLIFAIIITAVILKLLSSVVLPILISILLAFVFYPLCKKLHRLHIPWILCIVAIYIVTFVFFYIVGNLLIASMSSIIGAYPKYEQRFSIIYQTICSKLHIEYDANSSLFANILSLGSARDSIQSLALLLSSTLMSFGKQLTLILLLSVFLLVEMQSLKNKVTIAFSDADLGNTIIKIVTHTVSDVTHFLSIKFIISLITGIIIFVAAFAIGLDFPIVWGFLAFVMNFIPTFGSIASCGLTIIFSILQFYPDFSRVIIIALVLVLTNMILGNIVEPRWEGADLGLSPFIILVSLSFWGWMWGFLGMILAVPLTVIVKIICENVDILKPIAIIIGGKPKMKTLTQGNAGLPFLDSEDDK